MTQDGTDQSDTPATDGGTVVLLDNDLFFVVKVTETLTRAGYSVHKARNLDAFTAALGQAGAERPVAAMVNLAARGIDALAAIALARDAGVPLVAYGPHVDTAAQTAARQAGAISVIANAKLAGDLPGVLARALRRARS